MRRKVGLGPEGVRLVEHMVFCETGTRAPARRVWSPATDVYETPEAIVIQMEVAGVRPEEIQIQATDSTVAVWGRRSEPDLPRERHVEQMEIAHGPFERVIALATPVVAGAGRATCNHGLLEIVLPKATKQKMDTVTVQIRL